MELYGFFIKSVNFQRTVADVQILIENTSPVGLDADSLQYEVYIEGTEVTRGSYNRPIHLKASDTTLLTLPITLDNQRLLRTLRSLEGQRDSADYTLKANVFTDLPLLKGKPLQIKFTRRMPLYIIPELKMLEEQFYAKAGFTQRRKGAQRAQRKDRTAKVAEIGVGLKPYPTERLRPI